MMSSIKLWSMMYRFLLGGENIQLPISQIPHDVPCCKKYCYPAAGFGSHRTGPAQETFAHLNNLLLLYRFMMHMLSDVNRKVGNRLD